MSSEILEKVLPIALVGGGQLVLLFVGRRHLLLLTPDTLLLPVVERLLCLVVIHVLKERKKNIEVLIQGNWCFRQLV